MTSKDKSRFPSIPLPERTTDRSAAYRSLLRELLVLVGGDLPAADETDVQSQWYHDARGTIRDIVTHRAKDASEAAPVPEKWFKPLLRCAIHEPNPSFNRQLVEPAARALGCRR